MLNKIIEKTDLTESDIKNSETWGNYANNAIHYKGRISHLYRSGYNWYMPVMEEEKVGTTQNYGTNSVAGDLFTTGASHQTEKYHLFDVAGNVWEWTEETSHGGNATTQSTILRSGSCLNPYAQCPAGLRDGTHTINHINISIGFRVMLYMK